MFRAPVAQLDRASGFEPEGREFESLRARHSLNLNDLFRVNLTGTVWRGNQKVANSSFPGRASVTLSNQALAYSHSENLLGFDFQSIRSSNDIAPQCLTASAKALDDGMMKLRPFSSAKNCIFFASAFVFVNPPDFCFDGSENFSSTFSFLNTCSP